MTHTDEYIKLLNVLATFRWEVGTFYNGTSFFSFKPEVGTVHQPEVGTLFQPEVGSVITISHHITHQAALTSHQGERAKERESTHAL